MKKNFIPVNEPLLDNEEKKYLIKCINDNQISSSGSFVKEFEKKFAKTCNRKYAVAVSNGTSALQIAYDCFKLKKNDEVIVPAFTIISCILPVARSEAKPILVDSNIKTWNVDVEKLLCSISNNTKAIILPHTYGLPVDLDPILKVCKKKNIILIEDAAEVLGLNYKNKPCGSFGDISTFSFFANKHITTGEGGMIVTDNYKLYQKCLSLRNLCFNNARRFKHYELGWNSRITNLQCAVGLAQLKKLKKFVFLKRKIGNTYYNSLSNLKYLQNPLIKTNYAENIFWVYGLLLKENSKIKLETFRKKLFEKGVDTRNFFWPMNKQPVLKKYRYFKKFKLDVAEYLSNNGFYIPSGLALSSNQQKHVIRSIKEIID